MPLKIGNVVINGPKTGMLVLPREPDPIVFNFVSVNDQSEFELVFPRPTPRKKFDVKSQKELYLVDEPAYKAKVELRGEAFHDWSFLQSIKPSNVEWQTVDANDPTTFANWRKEFADAGLSNSEINAIYLKYMEVNTLTNERLEEARQSFLASLAADLQSLPPSQTTDNQSSESGEHVNG